MATKFNDYMAIPENKWKVLSRLNVFRSSIDGELYIEEKDPAALGGDVNIKFIRDAAATNPTLDTADATNNRPMPQVQLAGDSLAPVAMGSGADGSTVQRVTLSTRHEAAATPVAVRLSNGTNFTEPLPVFKMNSLVTVAYDTIQPNLAGPTTDIYVYKTGGLAGATVATLTIEYADATKAVISSVVRT